MPLPDLSPPKSAEPKIRLLHCLTCNSIEELPWYEGPPEHDDLLEISVQRHRFPSGDPHAGNLFDVEIRLWALENIRKEIIGQIRGGGSKGLNEFDEKFYDTRSTFYEDAMACYASHMRPKGQCPDYMSDKKDLIPDTKSERREAGLAEPSKAPGPRVKLCQFCPVHTYNITQSRKQRGLYS